LSLIVFCVKRRVKIRLEDIFRDTCLSIEFYNSISDKIQLTIVMM